MVFDNGSVDLIAVIIFSCVNFLFWVNVLYIVVIMVCFIFVFEKLLDILDSWFRLKCLIFWCFFIRWIWKIFWCFFLFGKFIKKILLNLFFFKNFFGRCFIWLVVVIINIGEVFFCI